MHVFINNLSFLLLIKVIALEILLKLGKKNNHDDKLLYVIKKILNKVAIVKL